MKAPVPPTAPVNSISPVDAPKQATSDTVSEKVIGSGSDKSIGMVNTQKPPS
ncbi:hypothetical protein D3C86_2061120 [compost metagenome]